MNGDLDTILFPINHGMLYFVGFDVLPPFVAYAPARVAPEQRDSYLRNYEVRLRSWQMTPRIDYRPLADYDETLQLSTDTRG